VVRDCASVECCRGVVVDASVLVCQCDGETAGGGSSSVLRPDLGNILAQGRGIDAGAGDGLPSDLEIACGEGVRVGLVHVGFDLVPDCFDLGADVICHLAQFGQFIEFADEFVGCHVVFPPSCSG